MLLCAIRPVAASAELRRTLARRAVPLGNHRPGLHRGDYVRHAEALAPVIFKLRTWTCSRVGYELDEVDAGMLDR